MLEEELDKLIEASLYLGNEPPALPAPFAASAAAARAATTEMHDDVTASAVVADDGDCGGDDEEARRHAPPDAMAVEIGIGTETPGSRVTLDDTNDDVSTTV